MEGANFSGTSPLCVFALYYLPHPFSPTHCPFTTTSSIYIARSLSNHCHCITFLHYLYLIFFHLSLSSWCLPLHTSFHYVLLYPFFTAASYLLACFLLFLIWFFFLWYFPLCTPPVHYNILYLFFFCPSVTTISLFILCSNSHLLFLFTSLIPFLNHPPSLDQTPIAFTFLCPFILH